MYQYVLFDLDGTLTDPGEGIVKCFQYALASFGIVEQDEGKLLKYIGPPLTEAFSGGYGMNEADTERAVRKYRERFSKVGLFENKVYEGMRELLSHVRDSGKVLAVATSKPREYAERILEKFALAEYFTKITGSGLDGSLNSKAAVIAASLKELSIPEQDYARTIMVGDRKYDVAGAKENGLYTIGVEYGYPEPGELKKAGAKYIVQSVRELEELLLRI